MQANRHGHASVENGKNTKTQTTSCFLTLVAKWYPRRIYLIFLFFVRFLPNEGKK
jgi:hypothetical protein